METLAPFCKLQAGHWIDLDHLPTTHPAMNRAWRKYQADWVILMIRVLLFTYLLSTDSHLCSIHPINVFFHHGKSMVRSTSLTVLTYYYRSHVYERMKLSNRITILSQPCVSIISSWNMVPQFPNNLELLCIWAYLLLNIVLSLISRQSWFFSFFFGPEAIHLL